MMNIGPGSVLRLRNVRTYGSVPSMIQTKTRLYRADLSPSGTNSNCVVGFSPYELVNKSGEKAGKELDTTKALNQLGWLSERQLRKAGVSEKALAKAREQSDERTD